jgi:hypothetical protein
VSTGWNNPQAACPPARSSHVDVPGSRHLGSIRYTPHMPHRRRTGCVLSVLASKIQTWSHMASASRASRYCSESSRIGRARPRRVGALVQTLGANGLLCGVERRMGNPLSQARRDAARIAFRRWYKKHGRAYRHRPDVKAKQLARQRSPEHKAKRRAYEQRRDVIERRRAYSRTYRRELAWR